MHIHILGICGTFMAGIAAIAREAGHRVTGSDAAAWPPMSTQLEALGITVMRGYEPAHLQPEPDVVVVGNVITRGNAAMEHVLDAGLPYVSGPQWLAENVLRGRHVLAVAGTHGKTTTASILAWLLDDAGLNPGFLIGGVPQNFGVSARLGGRVSTSSKDARTGALRGGDGKFFVVEADEYDTAFFDKRSKFVHYGPRTCILNNLEYDHADIFPDLASIERQFHHLVRTVPKSGRIIVNGGDEALARVLKQGCWSELDYFNDPRGWQFDLPPPPVIFPSPPESGERTRVRGQPEIAIRFQNKVVALGTSPLAGAHNHSNALAAIAAAAHVGVPVQTAMESLAKFRNVKRRMELIGEARGVKIYDDFAHHPTAIEVTIAALRSQGPGRILAVLEPRSNTMRMGVHASALVHSLQGADQVFVYARPDLKWDAAGILGSLGDRLQVLSGVDSLVASIVSATRPSDRVLFMSNGDFGGIYGKILTVLNTVNA